MRNDSMRMLSIALVAGATIGLGVAGAAADAVRGQIIAERWCAACHLVGPDQTQVLDGVASFSEVARREDVTADGLAAFLASPHPMMPDMGLTRDEIRDLTAYIESLE